MYYHFSVIVFSDKEPIIAYRGMIEANTQEKALQILHAWNRFKNIASHALLEEAGDAIEIEYGVTALYAVGNGLWEDSES